MPKGFFAFSAQNTTLDDVPKRKRVDENMILDTLEQLQNARCSTPASDSQIRKAETELNIKFAAEYIRYLKLYGQLTAKGTALTGITDNETLNVVYVTKKAKRKSFIPRGMYVIEDGAIDNMPILQDENGTIYIAAPKDKPKELFASLASYLKATKELLTDKTTEEQ